LENADSAGNADSPGKAGGADNAEGVKELSPGWRLCGTLGTDNQTE
jgi:hypothetical protein